MDKLLHLTSSQPISEPPLDLTELAKIERRHADRARTPNAQRGNATAIGRLDKSSPSTSAAAVLLRRRPAEFFELATDAGVFFNDQKRLELLKWRAQEVRRAGREEIAPQLRDVAVGIHAEKWRTNADGWTILERLLAQDGAMRLNGDVVIVRVELPDGVYEADIDAFLLAATAVGVGMSAKLIGVKPEIIVAESVTLDCGPFLHVDAPVEGEDLVVLCSQGER